MPGRIQSIERASALLRLLSGAPQGMALGEVSRSSGLPKGTALGILRTLQHTGLVEQDPGTGHYRLGGEVLSLGNRYLDGNELRARSLGRAEDLASLSGESVRVGVAHKRQVLVLHHAPRPAPGRQTLDVGALLPLHATSLGQVLSAFAPPAETGAPGATGVAGETEGTGAAGSAGNADANAPVPDLAVFTRRTLTSPGALAERAAAVRAAGWAWEAEELVEGEMSVSAPVRDRHGATVGAIGIHGAVERLRGADGRPCPEQVSYVRDAARAISRELGAAPF